ncbi:MAG: permease [Clostridia bacterium]|nr:permease [Clostridia bacterium]
MENQNKKSLKWLWISIAVAVVALLAVWCIVNAINNPKLDKIETPLVNEGKDGIVNIFNFSTTFVLFVVAFLIIALGYLLGGIDIKGVTLGTAGVFLVAILFGFLCTIVPENVPLLNAFSIKDTAHTVVKYLSSPLQNMGLILFVGSVGFIAGPNFFKDLAKNFKTYIVLGIVIILSGTLVAVICTLLTPDYGPEFWSGVLSGALTSTPGFSAAVDAADPSLKPIITLGHAIAYPFGVVGVVLFVQLLPKFLKADMNKERELLKLGESEKARDYSKYFKCEPFGLMPFGLAIIAGLLLGSITIPLSLKGYDGPCFSLGTTGGVLIMCLVFGHLGHIGKLSLEVTEATKKILREFGLALFLLGAGFEGGVALVEQISAFGGAIVAWGFIGGALMTIVPMVAGFFISKCLMKLPLLNGLGSITGGMTSTPALGTLIHVSKTEDVASAYASTYPIALVLVVLACQLMITLM